MEGIMNTRILVVDDSATDRLLIEKILTDYDIISASSGKEALKILSKTNVDMIILDLNMPDMNGFEVLEQLKMTDRYQKIRVLILTNLEEVENEIKGLQLGAVDFIRKPVNMYSLQARIETHLELLKIQNLFERKLKEEILTIETLISQAPIGIAIAGRNFPLDKDQPDEFLDINHTLENITGRSKDQLLMLGWQKITHPEDLEKDYTLFHELENSAHSSFVTESRYLRPDNSVVWVNISIAKLEIDNGYQYNYLYLVQNIDKRKQAEIKLSENERSNAVLLDNLPGMMYRCKLDRNWTMLYVSSGCFELTGYTADDLLDNKRYSYNDLIKESYQVDLWEKWQTAIKTKTKFLEEYEIITASGQSKWVWEQGQGIYDNQGNILHLEGLIIDINERKKNELSLKHVSEHNPLTDLLNLRSLEKMILTQQVEGKIKQAAMVMIYVRRYNHIVTTYGYKIGNQLILEITKILRELSNEKNILFQPFSDRFVFYIHGYNKKGILKTFAQKIVDELDKRIKQRAIGFSIGIIEIDHKRKEDAATLLRQAAIASEHYNLNHHISYSFYDKKVAERNTREKIITEALEKYIYDDTTADFHLVFQPIVDLKTARIVGFEALARFADTFLGDITPSEFIPVTESSLLILPLGKKIMEKSFVFAKKLENEGFDKTIVSFNVSAIQLLNASFINDLIDFIHLYQVNPANLNIEFTESIFSDNYQEINNKIDQIHALGLQVSIDDFGTGYSSLAREEELNVNCLKIDRYFVKKITRMDPDKNLISDIISMAHKLGHQVVAEGVENKKQLDYLIKHNCDLYQGYYFSKPLKDEEALNILIHNNIKD